MNASEATIAPNPRVVYRDLAGGEEAPQWIEG
jgi:hypothetical protein